MNLEELILDMAARGELTHLSLSPVGKEWAVSFCAASPIGGYTFIVDKDPVTAMRRAMEETKLKKRRVTVAKGKNPHDAAGSGAGDSSPS